MIACNMCNNNCENANGRWQESINSAEFCEFIVAKVRNEAKAAMTYGINIKTNPEIIERHLNTISHARDFWHNENLFDESNEEECAVFWGVLDQLIDTVFEYE